MAALTVQNVVNAGTKPTFAAPTVSDTVAIGNASTPVFLVYKNTDTNIKTLTFVVPGTTSYGDTYTQHVVSLPATTGEVWVPIRKAYDDGTGNATVNLTGTGGITGVTVAAVQVS